MPAEEGGYIVMFADFPEAFTQGKNLSDAMFMAEDVLKIAVEEYARERRKLPDPSSYYEAFATVVQRNAELGIHTPDHTFMQLVAAPDTDTTPIKVTMSLPRNVLSVLDIKAKHAGMTRSGYISRLAQEA